MGARRPVVAGKFSSKCDRTVNSTECGATIHHYRIGLFSNIRVWGEREREASRPPAR